MNFDRQRALVTGGSTGVGFALARALIAAGAKVAICGRDAARLAAARERLGDTQTIDCDVANEDDCRRLVATTVARLGGLSLLINNAGVQTAWSIAGGDSPDAIAAARVEIATNFMAPIALTALAWPHLTANPDACVVNIGSGLGLSPKRSAPVYGATKAALANWSRALRYQAEGTGVRVVHAVLPLVDTAMTAGRGRGKITADDAAATIVRGLAADREEIWVGKARLLPTLSRLAPGVLSRVLRESR